MSIVTNSIDNLKRAGAVLSAIADSNNTDEAIRQLNAQGVRGANGAVFSASGLCNYRKRHLAGMTGDEAVKLREVLDAIAAAAE